MYVYCILLLLDCHINAHIKCVESVPDNCGSIKVTVITKKKPIVISKSLPVSTPTTTSQKGHVEAVATHAPTTTQKHALVTKSNVVAGKKSRLSFRKPAAVDVDAEEDDPDKDKNTQDFFLVLEENRKKRTKVRTPFSEPS